MKVPSVFVKGKIWLMAVVMPAEKVEICSWMYSMSDSEFGADRPIFIISCVLCPDRDNAHSPPERSEWVSTQISGIPLPG